MPERTGKLVRFPHIDDGCAVAVRRDPLRFDLFDPGIGPVQGRPTVRGRPFSRRNPTADLIRGHRLINLFRMREAQVFHESDEIIFVSVTAKSRIEVLFFIDATCRQATIIMRRIDEAIVRQRRNSSRVTEWYSVLASPCWKSVRPAPRMSSASPVKTKL